MEIDKGKPDWNKFRTGKYIIVSAPIDGSKNDAEYAFYQVGDLVEVVFPDGTKEQYEVMAIGDVPYAMGPEHTHPLDVYLTLPKDEYLKHVPDSRGAMKLFFDVEESKLADADEAVKQYCEVTQPQLGYTSRMTYLKDFDNMTNMFLLVGSALSFILALIGVLNFVNLTITSIHERKKELGILRAIGMTKKQMVHMLVGEGVLRICLTFAFVLTIGLLLNYLIVNMLAGQMIMFSYKFVIWPILLCMPIFLAVSMAVPRTVVKKTKIEVEISWS